MTQTIYVKSDLDQSFVIPASIDNVGGLNIDFSVWCDDNGDITTATVENTDGGISVTTPSVSSNVVSLTYTWSNTNPNKIKLTASGATNSKVILIHFKDEFYDERDESNVY